MKFSADKEVQKLASLYAGKPGWSCKARDRGHAKLVTPRGQVIAVPFTPSDHRAILNMRAHLRRVDRELEGATA
jgi:hypothetical protein